MKTIALTMEEAAQDLAALIRRMRERQEYVVVKDDKGPLAYLTLAFRPAPEDGVVQTDAGTGPQARTGPRVVYSERTGWPVVTARPGARMVTAEEIYEELRGSGP